MKKLLLRRLNFLNKIALFSVLLYSTGFTQNLVPNGSFEEYSQCPDFASQLPYAIGWTAPTNNSVDYMNTCSLNEEYSVPRQSWVNFQEAKSGQAYVGFYFLNGIGNDYREYIQAELNTELNTDNCYLFEFYVVSSQNYKFATNNLGLHISEFAISSTNSEFILDLEPQILKFGNPIISDTLNWVKVSGIYKANGNEKFITIGNFKTDIETEIQIVDIDAYFGAYYLIDEVSVIAVSNLPNGMPANAGLDKAIELGDSVFIGQEISNLNCTWRTLDGTLIEENISGIWVQPTEETTYVVEQNLCGTITYDTVIVYVNPVGLDDNLASPFGEGLRGRIISPNPNNGSFEIQNPNKQKLTFELKNALGQIVYQDKIITEKQGFELKLEKGIYFATFSSENGRFDEKIVIK
jgi:hypothetical protein